MLIQVITSFDDMVTFNHGTLKVINLELCEQSARISYDILFHTDTNPSALRAKGFLERSLTLNDACEGLCHEKSVAKRQEAL